MEAEHVLLPAFHPLDGAAELHAQVGDRHLLGEKTSLFPEPAADVGCGHPNALFGAAQDVDQVPAHFVGMLGRVPYAKQVVIAVVAGQQAPGFHRGRGETLHPVLLADNPVGAGEGRVDVSPGVHRP